MLLLDWSFSGADITKENAIIDLLRILQDNNHLILVSTDNNDGRSMFILCIFWKDLWVVFFDENHAVSIGLSPFRLKMIFFTLLSA